MTIAVNSTGLIISKPNIIIGGNFDTNPWQRQVTFTGASNQYTADRFEYIQSGTGVVDVLKTADAPTVAEANIYGANCLHIDVTTADAAIAAGDYYSLVYKVEGYDISSLGFGQSNPRELTLSFWHKHTKTGTYTVGFQNSASDRSYIAEYEQTSTDTWEKASITLNADSTGTWLYTNGVGLRIYFNVAAGSTFQTAAGSWTAGNYIASSNQVNGMDANTNNFKLDFILLNEGPIALPYPFENRLEVLRRCERYYFKTYNQGTYPGAASTVGRKNVYNGAATGAAAGYYVPAKVSMRTTPSGTVYSQAGTSGKVTQDDASEVNGAAGSLGEDSCLIDFTNGAGRNGGGCQVVLSAEL